MKASLSPHSLSFGYFVGMTRIMRMELVSKLPASYFSVSCEHVSGECFAHILLRFVFQRAYKSAYKVLLLGAFTVFLFYLFVLCLFIAK